MHPIALEASLEELGRLWSQEEHCPDWMQPQMKLVTILQMLVEKAGKDWPVLCLSPLFVPLEQQPPSLVLEHAQIGHGLSGPVKETQIQSKKRRKTVKYIFLALSFRG